MIDQTANTSLEAKERNLSGKIQKTTQGIIALIATIGFIPMAISEYYQQQKIRHEDKTLQLYERQLEDPLLEARKNLDVFYDVVSRKQYLEAITAANPIEKMKLFNAKLNKNQHKDIMILTKFYQGVIRCVETQVCDRDTADKLFGDDIKEFTVLFGPFFCDLRKELNDHTIALDLEKFRPRQKPLCNENNQYANKTDKTNSQKTSDKIYSISLIE